MQVTGVRRANAAAVESKRAATNITDVISATDVRALPDSTIVEALRRVPGLSVLPATDNEHPRDEAATPVLRGLGPSYNNVTIDGLTIASPGTPNGTLGSITRGVRLDLLPASMVSELQVVKTFTPDLDPNATGGAINLKTRSAFENGGKPFFSADAALGHANDVGKPRDQEDPGYRVNATGSRTFGSEQQYGVTVSANYQTLSSYTETHMTTDTVHYGFYDNNGVLQSGANLGNGWAVPQQDKYWYVQDQRDRYGVTGNSRCGLAQRSKHMPWPVTTISRTTWSATRSSSTRATVVRSSIKPLPLAAIPAAISRWVTRTRSSPRGPRLRSWAQFGDRPIDSSFPRAAPGRMRLTTSRSA